MMNQSYQKGQNQPKPYKQQYSSSQILQIMKKKPYSQDLNGTEYSYSILNKKQQTFFLTNNRFLYLKGIQSISYARQFPQNQSLPFTNALQIPKPKVTFPISEIQKITNDQQRLIIYFSGEKKAKWEFNCPSKVCSLQWRKKLDFAIQELIAFNQSGFSNYSEYLKNKDALQEQKYNHFNLVNKLLQSDVKSVHTSQPSIQFHLMNKANTTMNESPAKINLQNSEGKQKMAVEQKMIENNSNNKPNQSPVVFQAKLENKNHHQFQNKPQGLLANSSQKSIKEAKQNQQIGITNNTIPQLPQKQLLRPTSVLFQGPKIISSKVQSFILSDSPETQFLSKSIANVSKEDKQKIKGEIMNLRRNWTKAILQGQNEVQLIIDFKDYAHKIGEVIINELYLDKELRMYPPHHQYKQYNYYLFEDVEVEVYFFSESNLSFYQQGSLVQKNPKYKEAVVQFKNYDYLIGQTKNQGILKVPLMMLFQFKGFLGRVKSRISDKALVNNRQVFETLDKEQFELDTNISSTTLLNQNHCRIVYQKPASFSKTFVQSIPEVYFIDRLTQFLPTQEIKNHEKLLRPQFIQDQVLDDNIFRNQQRSIKADKIQKMINEKIQRLVYVLENYQDYFTNSKELSEIIHSFGLNIRHLGLIYKKVKRSWLKRIIQAQLIARCAKKFFRLDIQNSVLQSKDKSAKKERQHQRERNRVISFLNIVFGCNEVTVRMWQNFNHTAETLYNTTIWDTQFTNINIAYLLQAIQTNFKIIMNATIHQKEFFADMDTFEPSDFERFQFDSTYYNLDFTQVFEEINQCLDEQNSQSFHRLCDILVSQSNSGVPYYNLLKNHPIHDSISEFLLQFTSPQQNQDLYNRMQSKLLPSRFTYQSKLAEIKWLLKQGKHENINKAIHFIEEHTKKWLGPIHPIVTKLNRILAEYFSYEEETLHLAIKYALISLEVQKSLFDGDCQQIWRDYYLVGKIYYHSNNIQQGLQYLVKAKQLVVVQNLKDYQVYGQLQFILARCFLKNKYFQESYSVVRQFYNVIKVEKDQKSLSYIIECVELIKYLLELNQQHQSYLHFLQSDFSPILHLFINNELLLKQAVKMIAIPYLKAIILKNTQNRAKILNIINQVSQISNNPTVSFTYLSLKIREGVFPKIYLKYLSQISSLIEEIQANQMLQRWMSFNKMTNQALLDKIAGSQITKGFQFLANLTAILNLLGKQATKQLFVMQK